MIFDDLGEKMKIGHYKRQVFPPYSVKPLKNNLTCEGKINFLNVGIIYNHYCQTKTIDWSSHNYNLQFTDLFLRIEVLLLVSFCKHDVNVTF